MAIQQWTRWRVSMSKAAFLLLHCREWLTSFYLIPFLNSISSHPPLSLLPQALLSYPRPFPPRILPLNHIKPGPGLAFPPSMYPPHQREATSVSILSLPPRPRRASALLFQCVFLPHKQSRTILSAVSHVAALW